MFGAEPEPAQPIISSLLVVEYLTPLQTPSRAAGSCMGALPPTGQAEMAVPEGPAASPRFFSMRPGDVQPERARPQRDDLREAPQRERVPEGISVGPVVCEIVDVCGVVLAVVQLHDGGADMRREGRVVIVKFRENVNRHSLLLVLSRHVAERSCFRL